MAFPLRIYDRDSREHRIQVVEIHSIKVGRAPSCDVVLDSRFVSSEHLLIRIQPDGAFALEHVGHNPTTVDGREVPPGRTVPIKPHEEIRIANFSLFIEGGEKEELGELSAAQAFAQLELELHSALVERIDLQQVSALGDERVRTQRILAVVDELVRERFSDLQSTDLRPEVVEHALRESLYSEMLHELMSRTKHSESMQRARGFVGRLDADAAAVVAEFLRRMGVTGTRRSLQEDLRIVDREFDGVFSLFTETASDGLIVVLVQRFLSREVLNLVCGRGPLQDLLELPDTSEIMVVHKDLIYVERAGRLQRLHRSFITDDILIGVIQRIVDPLNRKIDKSTPLVDARLPDGSRVNAVIPPLAVRGPCLTIRKFSKEPFPIERLLELGALTPPAATFLMACVAAHKNMIISGGTGSGKTTLLNILSGFISESERIVTIEDSAELQLRQEHVVTLETRPPNAEGRGAYTIRDLVRNALRMRPDRVIVGECRGGEALDMLQAMNTGHDGSLTTIHANTPADALLRLETLVLEAVDLPVRAIREQIAAAIHIIVQTQRLPSGKRMVTHVSEVVGLDEVEGTLQVDHVFEQSNGLLRFSGYLPSFIQSLVDDRLIDLSALFPPLGSPTR